MTPARAFSWGLLRGFCSVLMVMVSGRCVGSFSGGGKISLTFGVKIPKLEALYLEIGLVTV